MADEEGETPALQTEVHLNLKAFHCSTVSCCILDESVGIFSE